MDVPVSLPTVTVAGTVTTPDGQPLTGKTVTFATTAEMVDAAGNVLVPILKVQARVVNGALKAPDGTSALVLFASDTGVNTVPYSIRESWSLRSFTVNLLTTDVVGGIIRYSMLGPVSPAPTPDSPYATEPWVEQYVADHAGAVQSVAGVDPVSGDVPEAGLAVALGLGSAASHDAADFDAAGAAASALASAEGYTDAQVAGEASARIAADTALSSAVTAEATARSNADAAEVIARDAAIAAAVAALINGAPGALDTLKELADAINDDASFAAAVTTALAGKQPLDSDLTAIAALTTTAFGRALLALADAAALRSAAAVGSLATVTPTGTPDGTKFLRDDDVWAAVGSGSSLTINSQTGTSYTLALSDAGGLVECTNASPFTLTIPQESSVAWAAGTVIFIGQGGLGQVTIAAGSGVTLRSPNGAKTSLQWSQACLTKRATNDWILSGDVTA